MNCVGCNEGWNAMQSHKLCVDGSASVRAAPPIQCYGMYGILMLPIGTDWHAAIVAARSRQQAGRNLFHGQYCLQNFVEWKLVEVRQE